MKGRIRDVALMVERRRRRRIARLLRKMDRLDARQSRAKTRQSRTETRQRRRAIAASVALVAGLGGVMVSSMLGDTAGGPQASISRPPDTQDSRLQPPVTTDVSSDEFAYLQTQDGSDEPIRYDPCTPIHVVVNPRKIVDGGMRLLQEAVDEISEATGLAFVVDGLSQKRPPPQGAVTTDGGQTWRPVAVHWSDPAESKDLAGDVAGYAGSVPVRRDGRHWFVTGSVVLDGPQLEQLLQGTDGRDAVRAVIMHELGHLVGLDHIDEPDQLMQAVGDGTVTSWGAGDLTGLAALGDGPCIDY